MKNDYTDLTDYVNKRFEEIECPYRVCWRDIKMMLEVDHCMYYGNDNAENLIRNFIREYNGVINEID